MGQLTVVATPIGNLGDITPRAVEALAAADLVLAEDTRRTRGLLTHLAITGKETARLDAHAEESRIAWVLARLAEGARVVLVSDAGTPAISDPGARLVRRAADAGHTVTSLPGPSAVTTAIAASGFGGERFRFLGFVPRKASALARALDEVAASPEIVVLFESPARMATTLAALAERLGEREIVIAREISKKHEEYLRGSLASLAERERDRRWRGELTLVIGPRPEPAAEETVSDEALDVLIERELASGARPRAIAKKLAEETGRTGSDVYLRIVSHKERS